MPQDDRKVHILFKCSHNFTKIGTFLVTKTSPNEMKRMERMQDVFCHHNMIKIEIHSSRLSGRSSYIWKLNNRLLNNPWVKEKKSEALENILKLSEKRNAAY